MRRFLAAGLPLLVLAVPSHAATLRVPTDHASVQAAIDVAALGDTVLVAPGTYSDSTIRSGRRSCAFLKDGVVLRSESGPEHTVLDLDGRDDAPAAVVRLEDAFSDLSVIDGFTLTGAAEGDRLVYAAGPGLKTIRDCTFLEGPEDEHGGSALLASGDVDVLDCRFLDGRGEVASAIQQSAGHLNLLRSEFRDNHATPVRLLGNVDPSESALIEDCLFIDNRVGLHGVGAVQIASYRGGVVVRRCRFEDNRAQRGVGALVISGFGDKLVEECIFLNNRATHPETQNGAVAIGGGGSNVIRRNTFHGNAMQNEISWVFRGSAIRLHGFTTFESNVVSGSRGAPAIGLAEEGRIGGGGNIFWENQMGSGLVDDGRDFHVDPQLCDADAGDLSVAVTSPSLPGNHFASVEGRIGALDEGCGPGDEIPIGVGSNVLGVVLQVDGEAVVAPWLGTWEPGTSHGIEAGLQPQELTTGTRYVFEEWTDDPSPVREVVALGSYVEYEATFGEEHLVSVTADEGGSATPSTWVPSGATLEITASPEPGWEFVRWEGLGFGAYNGTANPTTVTAHEPLQERAIFRDRYPILTTGAEGDGEVEPLTGPQELFSVVEIVASPAPGRTFQHWIGVGDGAYSGPENPATVTMNGPITQTAVFVDSSPLLTMNAVGGGEVSPATGPQTVFTQVEIQAMPDVGWEFGAWAGQGSGSYSGGSNPASVEMNGPITQTATFVVGQLPLTMVAEEGGSVTPESGDVTAFTEVEIQATPDPGHRFVEWTGEGSGSYSGTDNPASVTLNGPISQVAHFAPAAFSATLSLSDTDPYVHSGGPIGLGDVHLWVTCGSTDRGLQSVSLQVSGSLSPLAFLPAPGVSAVGAGTILASIDGCPDGPVRLGRFLVNAPGEGSLCVDRSELAAGLTLTDCGGATYTWPENVGFVGVNTAGGLPCAGGTGCEELGPGGSAPVGAPDIATPVTDTRLAGIFPNPFGSGTAIRFDAARPMTARLVVFDVAGRQVRVLTDGSVPAGRHVVDWDGRDSSGRAASAGVYFVRLSGDGVEQTRKVTVVRP